MLDKCAFTCIFCSTGIMMLGGKKDLFQIDLNYPAGSDHIIPHGKKENHGLKHTLGLDI